MTAQRYTAPTFPARPGATPSLEGILAVVRSHHPDADPESIKRAHAEAALWHEGQRRRSGAPYITHCLTVAAIVADLGMPPPFVCAALLHDMEDTLCPPHRLADQFGEDVAQLVAAVPATPLLPQPTADTSSDAGHDAPGPSWETAVLAIRLADRLHNMRTIAFLSPATRHRKARETLDVFAPLARAAGLETVGGELHDLASAVLHPAPPTQALTRRLLAALTLLLPARQRARWREEWTAELAAHATRLERARFCFRVMLGAPRLSLTLRRPFRQARQS
ncbi:HD domain-containing protein [Streptomyces sp. NPDC001634]|uniref:HD domain-containing protein n=1 Tax=Streptomyces sp. NPDC001634 TaxID=3154390 RepID=UPI00332A69D1